MFIKDDVKRALFEACEALVLQVRKEEADAERICALSQAVRAFAAAWYSSEYDAMMRGELGSGSYRASAVNRLVAGGGGMGERTIVIR